MLRNPQKKLEAFFLKHKKLTYKKGSAIIHALDTPIGVYYLLEGYIKDSSVSSDGQEFTRFIFKPQDIFPYQYAFNSTPNMHSFTAMTACIVMRCPREKFLSFVHENPDVLFMITQRVLVRLRGVLQRLENMALGSAKQRVHSILAILAERFGKPEDNGVKILFPLSHKDIAELIGLTRETVSIEIEKLQKLGIISRTGRFYIIKKSKVLLF